MALQEFLEKLKTDYKFESPQLASASGTLYTPNPPALEQAHRHKLEMSFQRLKDEGHITGNPAEPFELLDRPVPSVVEIFIELE